MMTVTYLTSEYILPDIQRCCAFYCRLNVIGLGHSVPFTVSGCPLASDIQEQRLASLVLMFLYKSITNFVCVLIYHFICKDRRTLYFQNKGDFGCE